MSKSRDTSQNQTLHDARIGIIASRYNYQIVGDLLDACLQTLNTAGLKDEEITVQFVPGAFELPVAAQHMIKTGRFDAIITLGAVVRGETPHFNYISTECARGISQVALEQDIPVIFGVLTVDELQQAEARSASNENNKGVECAFAAIEMINLFREMNQ